GRLTLTSEGVARRCMSQDNDIRVHHGQERGALLNVLEITAVAFFLARQGAGGTCSDQAREVQRHTWRHQLHHLWLHRRIARRHQKAEPGSPAHHSLYSYNLLSIDNRRTSVYHAAKPMGRPSCQKKTRKAIPYASNAALQ